jgi:hypothetical protein
MTDALPKVFIDLQITGDVLDPSEVSAILPVTPRTAYRKGEQYFAGQRTGHRTGQTGVWYMTSDEFVSSPYLGDHAAFLWALFWPEAGNNLRLMRLRDVLTRGGLKPTISIFWAGTPGQAPPQIPKTIRDLAAELRAGIETDFVTEAEAA